MPITSDYHMHTPRCKHAAGPMEAYIERGIAVGLREIGFADHNPLPNGLGSNVRMEEVELDAYVADVLRLRDRYRGEIDVRLGLEVDFIEGIEPYCAEQVRRYPWDYIIGSVHYLDPACREMSWPRNYQGDIHAVYARYYALIARMAETGWVDIVAHFDVPKRSGFPATEAEWGPATAALAALARAGVGVEVNTSGFRHPELVTREPYPAPDLLREAHRLGIPISVNSDAHAPRDVGHRFDEVADVLRGMGCGALATFQQRQRRMVPL